MIANKNYKPYHKSMEQDQQEMAITILTALTAIIHLFLGISLLSMPVQGITFILNGLGYITLVTTFLYLPQFEDKRPLLRKIFIGYTAVTFVAYFAVNVPQYGLEAFISPLGMIDKLIELVLLYFLYNLTFDNEIET